MPYDEVTQRDIDSAVDRAKSDLDYDIRRLGEELRSEIRSLEHELETVKARVRELELEGTE